MLPDGYASYYAQQVETISGNYLVARESYASEAVHDFRVGVKRFRSFVKLSKEIMPGSLDDISLKPLKKVYKAAGKIRDAQVQLELIDKLAGSETSRLKEFLGYMSKRELKGQLKFAEVQGSFSLDLFSDVLDDLQSAAKQYDAAKLIDKSRGYLSTALSDLYAAADTAEESNREFEELHEVRIQAKRVRYIVETLQTEDSKSKDLKQLNKRLRGVHRALGMWHDAEVGLQLLDKFRRKHNDLSAKSIEACDEYARVLTDSAQSGLNGYDKAWQWFVKDFGPQAVA